MTRRRLACNFLKYLLKLRYVSDGCDTNSNHPFSDLHLTLVPELPAAHSTILTVECNQGYIQTGGDTTVTCINGDISYMTLPVCEDYMSIISGGDGSGGGSSREPLIPEVMTDSGSQQATYTKPEPAGPTYTKPEPAGPTYTLSLIHI